MQKNFISHMQYSVKNPRLIIDAVESITNLSAHFHRHEYD